MGTHLSEGFGGFVHLVERQMLLYEGRRKLARQRSAKEPKGPYHFLAISRDIGALGDAIASEVARCLQWKVYDKEIVDYIANHSHIHRELLEQLDEKAQSLVHENVERWLSMFQGQASSYDEYHVALLKTLATLAAQGRSILLGHGSAYALRDQPGLRVRITGSLPVRVRRLSERWGASVEETQKTVRREDSERREFVQHHFKPDRNEGSYFHIVFNTDSLSVDHVAAAIAGIIEQSQKPEATSQTSSLPTPAFQSSEQSLMSPGSVPDEA